MYAKYGISRFWNWKSILLRTPLKLTVWITLWWMPCSTVGPSYDFLIFTLQTSLRNKKSLFRNPLLIFSDWKLFFLGKKKGILWWKTTTVCLSLFSTVSLASMLRRWSKEEDGCRPDMSISGGVHTRLLKRQTLPWVTCESLVRSWLSLNWSMRIWFKAGSLLQIFYSHLRWLMNRLGTTIDWMNVCVIPKFIR